MARSFRVLARGVGWPLPLLRLFQYCRHQWLFFNLLLLGFHRLCRGRRVGRLEGETSLLGDQWEVVGVKLIVLAEAGSRTKGRHR